MKFIRKLKKYFHQFLSAKSRKGDWHYRGKKYDKSRELKWKQGNNRMSYRGVNYTLLNSEIRIKEK